MKTIRKFTFSAGVALIAALLCGCVAEEMKLRYDPLSREPVKVAAILPLSGTNQQHGLKMRRGITLAVEELNHTRGISGRQVDMIYLDSKSSREGAVSAMEDAAAQGAVGVVGGYDTFESEGIVSRADVLRLPCVIPLATKDGLTEKNPFMFRNCFTDRQQAEVLAAYLWYWRKFLRVSVLIDMDQNAVYSRNIAREFSRYFRELGGIIASTVEFHGDDYEKALKEITSMGSGAILVPTEGERAAKMIRQLRKLGYPGVICGPDTWDDKGFFQALGADCDPGLCVYTSFYSDDCQQKEYRKFREAFRKRFFQFPGGEEVQSYDAVMFLASALSDAEDLHRFTKNWQGIRGQYGAAGFYTMLPNGDIDRTIYVNGIRAGKDGLLPVPRMERSVIYSSLAEYKEEN